MLVHKILQWRKFLQEPFWQIMKKNTLKNLVPHVIQGCAARQGMVFGLSVLNKVHNFIWVRPKQGMVSTIVVIK